MSTTVKADIDTRLSCYLKDRVSYSNATFVDAGGSAALYRVTSPQGPIAIKVYDPSFLTGTMAVAERRRLELQATLIGHSCPSLVNIFHVEEAHGTAFVEMEFIEWPQLKKNLANVPDSKVPRLINQLIEAVTYLEKQDIVHRDIKPENIHVSPDFDYLKLIDLGVARELALAEEEGVGATDHGAKRPFIATAQYSSPEYLFRLDAPSPTLWKGLSIYQVGAVLHDLIQKVPLFNSEVEAGNRWLVARAVLSTVPNFSDADPTRLATYKSLSLRCLTKELATRMALVDWADFALESGDDPLTALHVRLLKQGGNAGANAITADQTRLTFDRSTFCRQLSQNVRTALIAVCTNKIPVVLHSSDVYTTPHFIFDFDLSTTTKLSIKLNFAWQEGLHRRSCNISLSGVLKTTEEATVLTPQSFLVAVGTIGQAEELVASEVAAKIALSIGKAIDVLDATHDPSALNGTDVAKLVLNGHEG